MEVFEIDNLKKWDDLVKNSKNGTIFQSSDWLNTCCNVLNKKLKIYGCFENDKLVGGCSFCVNNLRFLKQASSVMGMSPYGGFLLTDFLSCNVKKNEQTYNDIIKSLLETIDGSFDNIRLINSPGFIDLRPFFRNGWNCKVRYAYYLKLDMEIEKNISKNMRWYIRKAMKNNITTKKLNDSSIFYKLFSMTFERQGLKPPFTKIFFEAIIDLLIKKKIGEMWVAESSGQIISAEIILYDNKRVYCWAAASHTDFKNLGGTSLLLYDIFQDLKARGFKEVNLMAANTPNLSKFMTAFNPILIPYYEIEKSKLVYKFFSSVYLFYKNNIK